MWVCLQAIFSNPVMATVISIFLGGLITWAAAWIYYKKAGEELKAETALLRQANIAVVYMLEHPDARVEVRRDNAGNAVGLIVEASGRAQGTSTARGGTGDENRDSTPNLATTKRFGVD